MDAIVDIATLTGAVIVALGTAPHPLEPHAAAAQLYASSCMRAVVCEQLYASSCMRSQQRRVSARVDRCCRAR
eukprot:6991991-Prymnesium_polylepis.1